MKKILVVDNHPMMLRFMTNLLQKEGYEVLTADDGLSALDILKTFVPDVVFIDLIMPNISGKKLCRIIRTMPKMKDAFLVIISAVAAEEEINFTEFGANAFIAKGPFNKMSEHILHLLDQPEKRASNGTEGKMIGLENVFAREITRELLASKRHFEVILGNMSEGILELNQQGKIVYANPASFSLIGIPEEQLLASNFMELFHGTHQQRIKDLLMEIGDGSQKITGDSPVLLNGKLVSLNILPIKDEAHESVLIILKDVTERKRMEAQIQRAQKMEAIGTLAGGIAHDFNNILSSIIGYTELANFDIPEGSKARQNLQEVLKASNRAKELVSQILAFSRQSKHERKPTYVSLIVKEALKFLRASLPATIEIRQNIECDIGAVKADPTQIHQVVVSLCTNAGHAMREKGGILEVSMANVDLDPSFAAGHPDLHPGPHVRLTLTDTGEGMTREVLERIFDPYFTTKAKGAGTGLGLSVVHGIVKSHGGMITAYSEPGKGSTFHVFFPVVESERKAEAGTKEPIPIGKERILFIDDEPALVNIGKEMLEHLGYEVVTRTSSIEALELFRTRPDQFDLVITDMTMPHMTGEQLAKELFCIRGDIPIMLCTGYSDRITEEDAKDIGIKKFAMKPLVTSDLAKAIRNVLDQN